MKINIEIDCTPAEAREFMGLPDITPLNEQMLAQLSENLKTMDPSTMMESMTNLWSGQAPNGFEQMSKNIWSQMMSASMSNSTPKKP